VISVDFAYRFDGPNIDVDQLLTRYKQRKLRLVQQVIACDADATVTVANGGGGGGGSTSVSFSNEDANDGYVKAAANGSGAAVGTLESSYGLAIGRGSDGKFNRAVLSFNTASIPDGATITAAVLSVGYGSAYGDPWSNPTGNTLVVDVRNSCFGACTIEASDHGATATASAVAQIARFGSGTQHSSALSAAGLAAISKAGRTQVRLRFASDQTSTNYLWIQHGASAQLTVEYVMP
jgi:hypothetical protein